MEQLEHRILFSCPLGPDWRPGQDNPRGKLIFEYEINDPSNDGDAEAGITFTWAGDPRGRIPFGSSGPVLTLTSVPAHSEIRVLAEVRERSSNAFQGTDTTPDGGLVVLNNLVTVSGNYVEGSGADINTGVQPNGGGSNVTVDIAPNGIEPDEDVRFGNVHVWIWQPTLTFQYPQSLHEGDSGNMIISRTGGDHGIYPIPVDLLKVAVTQPSPFVTPATPDEWTLTTSVTIPPVPAGSTTASVNAAMSVENDTAYEPNETAFFRVLPSNVHTYGGTAQQPSGSYTFMIHASDFNPYGGGYQSQGAFSDEPVVCGEEDDDELSDAVAGDLVGEIVP
jgi:hypothetical protein